MTEIACAVEAHDTLGECCLWCPVTKRVWWIDIQRACLQSFDPATRAYQVYPLPGPHVGCIALRRSGGLVVALDHGLHGFDPATGKLQFLVHPEASEPGNRYNDGRCDRRGRLWIGTMDIGIRRASGSFYRISADRSVLRLFDGITVPNSTAFSPDDRTLYFADTPDGRLRAYAFDPDDGRLGPMRVLLDSGAVPGRPDGATVDAEGCVWSARYEGACVARITPEGDVDRVVALPATRVTSCTLGGRDLRTLYITTARQKLTDAELAAQPHAGAVFALRVATPGLSEPRFGLT
jgi:sugar lactone lactonase YvrE